MPNFHDSWSNYGKTVLLVIAVTVLFFGPRILTRYFQSQRFNLITSAYDCADDAEPYLLTRAVRICMIDAFKDCFLVFLAAAFVFLSHYYLVNFRTN